MKGIFVPSKVVSESIVKQFGSPVFVTDQNILEERVRDFKNAFSFHPKIYYAVKANFNPHILRILKKTGVDGIDAVSPFEIKMAKRAGFTSSEIIFTGNASSDVELQDVTREEVICNIGSLSELRRFGQMFPGSKMSLRFNPGLGDGENENVVTGGQKSKFGILKKDFDRAKSLIDQHQLKLEGLHCHIGSGFYKIEQFQRAVENILEQALLFPNISFVDLGGGFGVRFQAGKDPIDLLAFAKSIELQVKNFEEKNGRPVEIRFEPGKFLVAESTCLLTTVTTRKKTDMKDFVCVDTGFHHLIRPALYQSYHGILNVSRPDEPKKTVTVVGNVCESTDVFADQIEVSNPQEGDVLAILSAGAYGASMSSLYNLRPYANEVIVNGTEIMLTRRTPDFNRMYEGFGFV